MATDREILDDVNNFWVGWNQRGPCSREYDIEDGDMRRKCREFEERKQEVDIRTSAFDEARKKYKARTC